MRKVLYGALLFAFALPVSAQDPVKVDPKHYKVEFENDDVRVLRVTYEPGEKSVMHEHPGTVAVFLNGQRVKFTYPDGKTEEMMAKTGEARWNDAVTHLPENMGKQRMELILIEQKSK